MTQNINRVYIKQYYAIKHRIQQHAELNIYQ